MNRTSSLSLEVAEPELPFHNGVSAWWAALRANEPDLSYNYLMGMTGGVARTVVCSNSCLCREWRETAILVRPAVEAMGYRVLPLDAPSLSEDELRAKIDRSLNRGVPVPWFDEREEGVITGSDETDGPYRVAFVTQAGERGMRTVPLAELRRKSIYVVSRARHPRGAKGLREVQALISWIAYALRPPLAGACVTLAPPALNGMGPAAYTLWADLLEGERGPITAEMAFRARWWLDARTSAVGFLRELAGKQRTPYAVRLRRAADLFEREITAALETLTQLFEAPNGNARRDGGALLRIAAEIEAEAIATVAEAAFLGMRLDRGLSRALLESPGAPLHGQMLQEVVYLARAGARPLKQLAARRLAGSSAPLAISTLIQLLHDSDGPTSETALWALEHSPLHKRSRLFADAFRSVERVRTDTDQPLQRPLLFALAVTPDEEARAVLREALEDSGEGDRDPSAIREWAAALLYDRYRDHSVKQFEEAANSENPATRSLAERYLKRITEENRPRGT